MDFINFMMAMCSGFFFSLCIVLEKFHLLKFYKPYELLIFRRSIYPLFLAILVFCAPQTYRKLKNMSPKIAFFTFLTVLFGFLAVMFFWFVLKRNKTSNSIIIYPYTIIFALLISHYIYGEPINKVEICGLFLSIMGILIIGFNKQIIAFLPSINN